MGEKRRGKRNIVVRSESGIEREHLVPPGKRFLVHAGEQVKAGQSLVDGPLVPHDILRVSGEEAVQQYLLHEIQNVYRSQRVEINDKHIEIDRLRERKGPKFTDARLVKPSKVCDNHAVNRRARWFGLCKSPNSGSGGIVFECTGVIIHEYLPHQTGSAFSF